MVGYRLGSIMSDGTTARASERSERIKRLNHGAMHLLTCLPVWPTSISIGSYARQYEVPDEDVEAFYHRLAAVMNMPIIRKDDQIGIDPVYREVAQGSAEAWMRTHEGRAAS